MMIEMMKINDYNKMISINKSVYHYLSQSTPISLIIVKAIIIKILIKMNMITIFDWYNVM